MKVASGNRGAWARTARALLGVIGRLLRAWKFLFMAGALVSALALLGPMVGQGQKWAWFVGVGAGLGAVVAAVVQELAPGFWGWVVWPFVARGIKGQVKELWRELDGLPVLDKVSVGPVAVTIDVRVGRGQSRAVIANAAPIVAAGIGGLQHAVGGVTASTGQIRVILRDVLAQPRTVATVHTNDALGVVTLGRTQEGGVWRERLLGSTFLVTGVPGSGKGSVLWGVVGSLAPHVAAGRCELWGIDLKGGVELAMGERLFTRLAFDVEGAVQMLVDLVEEAERRMEYMRGKVRTMPVGQEGEPPMIMVVIDELATLTAYVLDKQLKAQVEKLLPRLLTIQRALGISTMAFVQDPRQQVVLTRGLFSRGISLRVRSAEEAGMATGVPAQLAPSHEIRADMPGVCWVVDETGEIERTRADYWTDDHIRELVDAYGAPVASEPLTVE